MKKFLIINILVFLGLIQNGFTKSFINSECPILFDKKDWEIDYTLDKREFWGRHESWFWKDGSIDESGDSFNFNPESEKSYNIIKNAKSAETIIYIGPWQKVTLNYPTHFWEEPKQIEEEIRLIGTYRKGAVRSHFETKDELNKNIPEQRLALFEPAGGLLDVCKLKWASRFGYDAVADYKLNPWRFFGGPVYVGSGKIINSRTGEIIADEKGNLINTKK